MADFEPKKLALIRILQILEEHSDKDHPLTQEDLSSMLENDYGIVIERKAIGRNISLLKEAGFDIGSRRAGCYLDTRIFSDDELRMFIAAVNSNKDLTENQREDLVGRIAGLSSKYFTI